MWRKKVLEAPTENALADVLRKFLNGSHVVPGGVIVLAQGRGASQGNAFPGMTNGSERYTLTILYSSQS